MGKWAENDPTIIRPLLQKQNTWFFLLTLLGTIQFDYLFQPLLSHILEISSNSAFRKNIYIVLRVYKLWFITAFKS